MKKSDFSFTLKDRKTADEVIEHELRQIKEKTDDYVEGHIKEYKGHIFSYTTTRKSGLASFADFASPETIEKDIQEDLGEISREENRFEVYLSVKGLEHYKYRMMFVRYGAISYPVTIVLAEDLAQLFGTYKETREANGEEDLRMIMDKILDSKFMKDLIQSLIFEAMRHEEN